MGANHDILRRIQTITIQIYNAMRICTPDLGAVGKHAVFFNNDPAAFVSSHMDRLMASTMHSCAITYANLVAILFDMELCINRRAIITNHNPVIISTDEEGNSTQRYMIADYDFVVITMDVNGRVIFTIQCSIATDTDAVSSAMDLYTAFPQHAVGMYGKDIVCSVKYDVVAAILNTIQATCVMFNFEFIA